MELDERKIKILKTIIQTYLETGEPVGSRTISRDSDLKLSSATIRNEMSDLEQMGYIIQPHTSSGRIPSDKGYRFYVDEIVKEKDEALKEKNAPSTALVIDRVDRLEDMLRQMAKAQVCAAFPGRDRKAPDCHGARRRHHQEFHCKYRGCTHR